MRDDHLKNEAPTTPARPVLRIVRSEPEQPAAQNAAAVDDEARKAAKSQSRTAQFLTAYADAIDRDIKLLLDL